MVISFIRALRTNKKYRPWTQKPEKILSDQTITSQSLNKTYRRLIVYMHKIFRFLLLLQKNPYKLFANEDEYFCLHAAVRTQPPFNQLIEKVDITIFAHIQQNSWCWGLSCLKIVFPLLTGYVGLLFCQCISTAALQPELTVKRQETMCRKLR